MQKKSDNLHAGHRARMRDKLFTHGREVFHTHELLEMLLYHVIPYKNTNPTAEALLRRFGNIEGVFSASDEELLSVEGIGPRILDLIKAASAVDVEKSTETFSQIVSRRFDDYKEVGEFFAEYFEGKFASEVVLLLLNNKMEYISCESIAMSDFDTAAIKVEPFIDAAISGRAAVAIIAHNHPYGPSFPTVGDKVTNDMIFRSLCGAGILLAEHYIVTGKRYLGFMKNISTRFSQQIEIENFLRSKEEIR